MVKAVPGISKQIVYLDLFSGTGGFALGLKQAGFVFKEHYFSEIDVHASSNYLKNFKHAVQLGDIKSISGKAIKKVDVITFGSPCQDLSLAGKRHGLNGKRSGLFFEALRLIRIYRPRVFVFENVKGIFSSNAGKDFEAVLRAFADLGVYDLQWQLLNTAWFLPQNRERLYLVGHLRGEARPKVFPIGQSLKLSQTFSKKGKQNESIASAITSTYHKGVHGRGETYISMPVHNLSGSKQSQECKTGRVIYQIPDGTSDGYNKACEGDGIDLSFLSINKKHSRITKGKSHTLVTKAPEYTLQGDILRRLTPVECERLQGFPDNWTKYGIYNGVEKEISDTQRYKMLGNAVSVVTVKAVAQKLLKNNSELGGFNMKYEQEPEIVLSGTVADIVVPELNVSYSREGKPFLGKIASTSSTADFIRSTFQEGELEMQEFFTVLYLNSSLNIIGYYRHSKGAINATLVDLRIILATALKCLATGIIVTHNHPSHSTKPSKADIDLTRQLKKACSHMNIRLVDHVIITPVDYYSFAANNMAGLEPVLLSKESFHEVIKRELQQKKHHTKLTLEKLAMSYGITDKTVVKELTELAIVETARGIGQEPGLATTEKYLRIVELYQNQVNLSHRTSQSILLQQYSTPAPIAYLMGIFCGVNQPGIYLEPSAGNGMLTIAGKPEHFCVNEIDDFRYQNLKMQGFNDLIATDASAGSICSQFNRSDFDAVLTNPPFGKMDTKRSFDNYPIQSLEHVMAIYALMCMKDEGKAAIIIGGHTGWDAKGRMQAGKNRLFFNYLYSHYQVADVIPINGKELYSRQGTSFNTRLILINGRKKKPVGNAPVYDKDKDTMVSSFGDLFERVMDAMDSVAQSIPETKNYIPLSSAAKRYVSYLKLQERYQGKLVLLRNTEEDHYEVFGESALLLIERFGRRISAEFLYKGVAVALVRIYDRDMEQLTEQLRKEKISFILADALQSPQEAELEKLEREAQELLQRLHASGLGSATDRELWQIPLAAFLEQEKEKHKLLEWKPYRSMNYSLPYKRQYYELFSNYSYADPYGHLISNPYGIEGSKNLEDWSFVKACLKVIHEYEVREAMKRAKSISEAVLSSYPNIKLEQQARLLKRQLQSGKPDGADSRAEKIMTILRSKTAAKLEGDDNPEYKKYIREQWVLRYKRALYYQQKCPAYYVLLINDGEGCYEAFGNSALLVSPYYINVPYNRKQVDYFLFGASELDYFRKELRKDGQTIVVIKEPIDVNDIPGDNLGLQSDLGVPGKDIIDFGTLHRQFGERKAGNPDVLYLFKTPEYYIAFDDDAEIISKVCNVRLIKSALYSAFQYFITGTLKSHLSEQLDLLKKAGHKPYVVFNMDFSEGSKEMRETELRRILKATSEKRENELGAPYIPTSNACIVLDTQVPDSMAYETHSALAQIKEAVGGDVDNFVRDRLGYPTKTALCKALSAEQTDAVMMAIYNIEARKQGMIIGDQTGIGKGRVAAAMIRYGCHQGLKPVFLTEKANLFSDIYRDMYAIGSGGLKPFIVNGRESKTDIKDEDGNIIYQALPVNEQQVIFSSREIPASFDFVVATYTQFNSPERKPEKPAFLNAIATDNLFIMDEAHNSSGSSNTGNFLQGVIALTKGVVFLSATFAKRPDNMPIYAMKTAIADCNMSRDELVESIQRGGVALQEVLSSQLVAEGQMLRRERSFEGVEVNYITLTEKAPEHQAIADNITGIVRDIIAFQKQFIDTIVDELDDIAVAEGKQVDIREGTSQAGVDNTPYFSKVFNIINQMLFSLKAASVAERAIERLKEGKKPVIAFSSTMGSFLEDMEDEKGLPVSDGSIINPDFSEVLRRGLEGVMRYTEKGMDGTPEYKKFEVSELPPEGQAAYFSISNRIEEVSTGITLSPIDIVVKMIRDAGYSVAEVTGRKYELQFADAPEHNSSESSRFIKGDRVKVIASGKTGEVEYVVTSGTVIPGVATSGNVTHEYAVKLDSGSRWTFKAAELAPESNRVPMAVVLSRKKINTNDAFRRFNNNEVDVLMINQSGSTGASAHAIPTFKVPKPEVKQRVMIVLQAELDINTEVQKRGRINRTGQIIKPIYDYVSSAIPAESRLMMMLQKKLKSLDANTASNQKQSSKILDVPDFLNKYGDRIVKEYLLENPEVNTLLDNPLRLKNQTDSDEGEADLTENAAHKVSGRVAVLSAKMQQDFYTEITERYNDYIGYLQQIGEYDLELEAMNLEAETINSKVVKMGKGSGSLFSEDSILETVEANVLKKPFTVAELDNLLTEALKGSDAIVIQEHLKIEYATATHSSLAFEEKTIIARFAETEKGITQEKKYIKLKTEPERKEYIEKRNKEIEEARAKAIEQAHNKAASRKHYLTKLFNFYYVGRSLRYPVDNFGGYKELVPAVFLGFVIDPKQKNPFLPSKVKLRFAIANSSKYLAIPASYGYADTIIGASIDTPELSKEQILLEWETYTKANNRDRRTRHIITGNLLQAFSDYKGKLVNYTTIDGKVNKGILMPENWAADEQVQDKVSVPVLQALPIIKSLVQGKHITTSTGIGFLKQANGFKIIVPASRVAAGNIYLDKQLLELVEGNNFQKSSDKMVAMLDADLLDDFVAIIDDKHSCSVTITRYQFTGLERQKGKLKNRLPIRLPEPEPKQTESSNLFMLELEAEALTLKLRLLAA